MFRLSQKGEQIQQMFNTIAPTYDFLNHLLSFGIDKRWRRRTVSMIDIPADGRVLDVATGTGDVALEVARQLPASVSITGADFSAEMVARGQQKIKASPYHDRISFTVAPCEDLPFPDNHFDAITIAFGIRNVVDRRLGLAELWRVANQKANSLFSNFQHQNLPFSVDSTTSTSNKSCRSSAVFSHSMMPINICRIQYLSSPRRSNSVRRCVRSVFRMCAVSR